MGNRMRFESKHVVITGGGTGIGFAMAERMVARGAKVTLVGRRAEALRKASRQLGDRANWIAADVATAEGRQALVDQLDEPAERLDMLVNNAGIQRRIDLRHGAAHSDDEVATNLVAPIQLTRLLLPSLLQRPDGWIVNVTSGLAFVPMASAPVYCATKAALHSFSMSLRLQLQDTRVRVVEVIPPSVDTELHQGSRIDTSARDAGAISAGQCADAALSGIERGRDEVFIGLASILRLMSKVAPKTAAARLHRATEPRSFRR